MGDLINQALDMGWPALALLAGLLIYFQVSISDPAAKKRATFKTFIGIIAAFLLFIAISNYKSNFYGENRLLPVSLVMITATAFMMAAWTSSTVPDASMTTQRCGSSNAIARKPSRRR